MLHELIEERSSGYARELAQHTIVHPSALLGDGTAKTFVKLRTVQMQRSVKASWLRRKEVVEGDDLTRGG